MAEHAHTTSRRTPEPAAAGAGRRSALLATMAGLLAAPAAALAAPGASWAAPLPDFGSSAEQRFWRCLGMVHIHNHTIGELMDENAPDAEIAAVVQKVDLELDRAAAIPADTREAFRLKALIAHKHGDSAAGERVLRGLLADLMSSGDAA